MASGPITSWEIDGEAVETERDFILLGSKITVDGDCTRLLATPWTAAINLKETCSLEEKL